MKSLFEPSGREEILSRLGKLSPSSTRQWGKMNPGQMLTHCSITMEMATGDEPKKQALIGVLLAPFFKKKFLGEEPMSRNSPTNPAMIVTDERDFEKELARLRAVIGRFCDAGPDAAARQTHTFFGRLTGDEWGRMMFKHLDHHFRQFSA